MSNELSGDAHNVVQAAHIGSVTFNAATPPAPHLHSVNPPTLDVPVRGREAELLRLIDLVEQPRGRFAVVSGPGGAGKSTLAAELAARAGQRGITVWWIRWREEKSLAAQLLEIAETVGLPARHRLGLPDLVWAALAGSSRWLLVIDNVDQPHLLSPTGEPLSEYRGWVRAGGSGLLLVTSRDADPHQWGPGAELITLEPLATDDAATVLTDAAPDAGPPDQARELAARLGGIPLALRAAGRAIAQPTARHHTFDTYRAALASELGDALAVLRTTWELSLNQLAGEGHPLAGPLLGMLSLAADAPVPRGLITPALLRPVDADATQPAVDGALAGLHRYGLIQASAQPIPCVALHPMVREITATRLAGDAAAPSWQDALDRLLLDSAREAAAAERSGWDLALLIAPHLVPIPARHGAQSELVTSAGDTLWSLYRLLVDARYTTERELGRGFLDGEPVTDIQQPAGVIRDRLADAVRRIGEFERAFDLLRPILPPGPRISALRRSPTHPHQFQYESMSRLFENLVEAREIMLGREHPDTLRGLNNLAVALGGSDQYLRAVKLHRKVLAVREELLGPRHPDTTMSRVNLAALLKGDDVNRA